MSLVSLNNLVNFTANIKMPLFILFIFSKHKNHSSVTREMYTYLRCDSDVLRMSKDSVSITACTLCASSAVDLGTAITSANQIIGVKQLL